MARGMVNGEAVVSQASTDAFRDGYSRTFGERKPQRGRWVWDARAGCLVSADKYESEPLAVNAPILSGRCHEGQVAPDGTDIGTARKRARWMKDTGTADHADYKQIREKAAAEKDAKARGEFKPDKQLRDLIGRELYKQKVIL